MAPTMDDAWAVFDKAVRMEQKGRTPTSTENMSRIAARAADKLLDEACAIEREVIG